MHTCCHEIMFHSLWRLISKKLVTSNTIHCSEGIWKTALWRACGKMDYVVLWCITESSFLSYWYVQCNFYNIKIDSYSGLLYINWFSTDTQFVGTVTIKGPEKTSTLEPKTLEGLNTSFRTMENTGRNKTQSWEESKSYYIFLTNVLRREL